MQSLPAAFERYPGAARRTLPPSYQRREPEKTALYQIVNRNLEACLEQARDRSEHGFGYPRFVERELEKFLGCGLLRHGFVRVRCSDCANERLVAFSCKGRGFCPSCTARRMANTAAHLVDNVLPQAPYRQWVISFPKRVRFLLARDHDLLSAVLDICLRKIFAWQRRRARSLGVVEPMSGSVSFCQRFGSLLNLNCHFHSLLPDGVFVATKTGVEFVPIPPPWPEDIDRLVQQMARATEKLIARRIREEPRDEPPSLLEIEQARSTETTPCPRPRGGGRHSQQSHKRAAFHFGYSLHADRHVDADNREALERLCRYGARSPIANSRLSLGEDGKAVIELKRPFYDGRTHLTFEPIELVQKLAVVTPPPRKNLTRFHGVFAPAHRYRSAVVPRATMKDSAATVPTRTGTNDPAAAETADQKPSQSTRLSWAELLRRVFAIDILRCDWCGAPMRIIAVIPESPISDKILDHLGLELASNRSTGPPGPRPRLH